LKSVVFWSCSKSRKYNFPCHLNCMLLMFLIKQQYVLVSLPTWFLKYCVQCVGFLNEHYELLVFMSFLLFQVPTLGIDLNSVCTRGSLTFTVLQTSLSRLPLSPSNLVSRLRWPLQTLDLDPSFNLLCFLVPISYIFVVSVLGQSWLVFVSYTVVDIDEWLKKCYAQYALDFYQIKLLSLDKIFQFYAFASYIMLWNSTWLKPRFESLGKYLPTI